MTRPANFATGKISQISEFGNVLRSWQGCCEVGNGIASLARWFAKLAMWFANLAMGCEFGKVVCEFGNGFAKLAMWFAKLAMWFAKLAMRIFAKVLKFLCETNEQCMWLANFAMRTEIAN